MRRSGAWPYAELEALEEMEEPTVERCRRLWSRQHPQAQVCRLRSRQHPQAQVWAQVPLAALGPQVVWAPQRPTPRYRRRIR